MPKQIIGAIAGAALVALSAGQSLQAQGSPGQPVIPAKITFANSIDHAIWSDGSPYIHQEPFDLEVFIGSQANDGNIWHRVCRENICTNTVRKLRFTFPANSCGLNNDIPLAFHDFHFSITDANSVIKNGLLGMSKDPSNPTNSLLFPMRLRFFQTSGSTINGYILHFNGGGSACKGKSEFVKVTREAETKWKVSSEGKTGCVENSNTKVKNPFCFTGSMDFSFTIEPEGPCERCKQ